MKEKRKEVKEMKEKRKEVKEMKENIFKVWLFQNQINL